MYQVQQRLLFLIADADLAVEDRLEIAIETDAQQLNSDTEL